MQFQRRHRNRTKVHPLANGNVRSSIVSTSRRFIIAAFDEEQCYRLEMTYDEAIELAREILAMTATPQQEG